MNCQKAHDSYLKRFFLLGFFLLSPTVFLATPSFAQDYSFSWTANTSQVEGYNFYYKKGGTAGPPFDGYEAIEGESPISVIGFTSFTISGLEDYTTYHFALTAYDGLNESDFTDIITVYYDEPEYPVDDTVYPDEDVYPDEPNQKGRKKY